MVCPHDPAGSPTAFPIALCHGRRCPWHDGKAGPADRREAVVLARAAFGRAGMRSTIFAYQVIAAAPIAWRLSLLVAPMPEKLVAALKKLVTIAV